MYRNNLSAQWNFKMILIGRLDVYLGVVINFKFKTLIFHWIIRGNSALVWTNTAVATINMRCSYNLKLNLILFAARFSSFNLSYSPWIKDQFLQFVLKNIAIDRSIDRRPIHSCNTYYNNKISYINCQCVRDGAVRIGI